MQYKENACEIFLKKGIECILVYRLLIGDIELA